MRSVALLVGVLVSVSAYIVLTANVETSELQVTGTVDEASRGAYQILVRPPGAATPLETDRGLVNSNSVTSQGGGITYEQWHRIAELAGVQTAAPIAQLGYIPLRLEASVDLTSQVDPGAVYQWFRLNPVWTADQRLSSVAAKADALMYVTSHTVAWPSPDTLPGMTETVYSDGVTRHADGCGVTGYFFPVEVGEDGGESPICVLQDSDTTADVQVAQRLDDGTFLINGVPAEHLTARVVGSMWVPVAAVDPAAEATLIGLDSAMVDGGYLTPTPPLPDRYGVSAPVILAGDPPVDQQVTIETSRVDDDRSAEGRTLSDLNELAKNTSPSRGPVSAFTANIGELYRDALEAPDLIMTPAQLGPVGYQVGPDGVLQPQVTENTDEQLANQPDMHIVGAAPEMTGDTAFREVSGFPSFTAPLGLSKIGVFDRSLTREFPAESRIPLDSYSPGAMPGADEASRELLGGQALQPNGNPAGYVATSPSVLMSLQALQSVSTEKDPISAVRVAVDGVTGIDAVSRERVRLVAEAIVRETGLTVDIVQGSSPSPQQVRLPAGQFGRPELLLEEAWSKKNVAATIIAGVQRKSLILFILVLAVCAMFVANAAAAAVRSRRTELGVLACLGWGRRALFGVILGELAALGLAAGLLGVVAAWAASRMVGVEVTWGRALLAVPAALAITLLAGLVPALSASRADPMEAVRPAISAPRRASVRAGLLGLAVANTRRVPGRTLLGALALMLGTGALTLLLAVSIAFKGALVGTVLGDAVAVQVTTPDLIAVAAMLFMSAFAVGDVLYLNIRDRAAEFATLRATGWTDATLARLALTEGGLIGLLGSLTGTALGTGVALALSGGDGLTGILPIAAGICAGGTLLALAATTIPIRIMNRASTVRLLTEE